MSEDKKDIHVNPFLVGSMIWRLVHVGGTLNTLIIIN